MRKNVFGKQLNRDKNQRKALIKSLMTSLVLEEQIKTTETKAKAIRSEVDKLITKARKETNLAKRLLEKKISSKAIEKLIKEITPRFTNRNGGYTRIIRLGKRLGDDAQMVIMEWVEKPVENKALINPSDKNSVKSKTKRSEQKNEKELKSKDIKSDKKIIKKETKKSVKKAKK